MEGSLEFSQMLIVNLRREGAVHTGSSGPRLSRQLQAPDGSPGNGTGDSAESREEEAWGVTRVRAWAGAQTSAERRQDPLLRAGLGTVSASCWRSPALYYPAVICCKPEAAGPCLTTAISWGGRAARLCLWSPGPPSWAEGPGPPASCGHSDNT